MKRTFTLLVISASLTLTSLMGSDYRIKAGKMIRESISPVNSSDTGTQSKMLSRSVAMEKGKEFFTDESSIDTGTMVRKTAIGVAAEVVSIPVAVGAASSLGTVASTGTAIATLGGAAATSATLAAIGTSAVGTALGGAAAAVGIVAAPMVIGGAVVVGVAAGVAYGVNALIDMW